MNKCRFKIILLLTLSVFFQSCSQNHETVKSVMDNVVTRFYDSMDENELASLTNEKVLGLLTKDELDVLASRHWTFDVNIPVVVSLMRDRNQKVVPFWLEKSGFEKTEMVVTNEHSTYEVWQKQFDAGRIKLGINGFGKHRPHYFVSVKQVNENEKLKLSNFYPADQFTTTMDIGSFTYHDWDELVLTEVPESLKGGTLLTTIRGRAAEAHVIGAFRNTKFPSSEYPDQVLLSWSEEPGTTQSVQWRTSTNVTNGVVRYWKEGSDSQKDFSDINAEVNIMEDRLLQNDRYINRYTALIKKLNPATTYKYKVGDSKSGKWSDEASFTTAPITPAPFSFIYFGDTHKSPHWGKLINDAYNRFPNTAFYSIGGDIVSTGLHRNEWDELFEYSSDVIKNRPLMSTLGNHDSQDGLGSWMYTELFDLPRNGPAELEPETTYSFEYSDALFIMLDATSPIETQSEWLEKQLSDTRATWKIAMFHFPPFSYEEDYPVIRKEWGTLFDKYHVDLVFSGHVHYYMRSKPMYNQKPVASPGEGTVYVISIGIPNRDKDMPERDFVQVRFGGEMMYQRISIDGDNLVYTAYNKEGIQRDKLVIKK